MLSVFASFINSFPRFSIAAMPPFDVQCLTFIVSKRVASNSICPPPRGCAGGRIGTRFLRPKGTSPLKRVNPVGTPGYRNGTESFFCLKGRPSVVRDV